MAKEVLIPIPLQDFDPSETGIPWRILKKSDVKIVFATPTGQVARADSRMVSGQGLGPLKKLLAADENGKIAYQEMTSSHEFKNPIKWDEIKADNFDGIILPGGHAKGMRHYLESDALQNCVVNFFDLNKAIGAICHGVVLAARSKRFDGTSVLFSRKTTALLASQEMSAWFFTCAWLGRYYRTYPQTVEAEVKSVLSSQSDFLKGPLPFFRDNLENLGRGFVVRDKNYLSARWPGDAHLFSCKFLDILSERS